MATSPIGLDGRSPAESTRELVDAEVRRIVDDCYTDAPNEAVASALLEHETPDEADAYKAAGIDHTPRLTTITSFRSKEADPSAMC